MSIDASFYKNVFLLMQVVPASFECRKQFKKGMFNKPNTCGFIHVSHYLLSVHNSKQFKEMVKWPIIDKTNVKRYRAEIKDYLEVLAQENPDINFPPILMCYLVHAGGIRLLNIMWKISEISLRAYINRKYHATLLQAPKLGDNYNITKAYLTKINLKRNITISKCYEKTKFITKVFKLFVQYKSRIDNLKNIQTDIFNIMENIEKCIHIAPVRSSDKTELRNTENTEIINSWEANINESIKFIQKQNANLNKVKILSNTLHNLIFNLSVDCTIFDGNNLPNVNTEILPLCFNNNVQHVNDGLYKNGCLIFHTVLLIFNQVLKHMKCYLENDVLINISSCESTIIEHCKIIKSMEESFRKLIVEVTDMICDKKCSLQQKSVNFTSEINILHSTNLKIIFSPLKLNLSTNLCDNVEKLYERLYFTPEKGKYKHLFKRYRHNTSDTSKRSTVNLQFNNSPENIMIYQNFPQRQLFIHKQNSPNKTKDSPIYSRLLSPKSLKQNYFKDNSVSSPIQSEINETSKKSQIRNKKFNSTNLNEVTKDIFNVSSKITDVAASLSKSYPNSDSKL